MTLNFSWKYQAEIVTIFSPFIKNKYFPTVPTEKAWKYDIPGAMKCRMPELQY